MGERFEALYSAWCSGELSEEALRREFCQARSERIIYFDTIHLGTHRSYIERNNGRGERGMTDTVQPPVPRSVHPAGERKC